MSRSTFRVWATPTGSQQAPNQATGEANEPLFLAKDVKKTFGDLRVLNIDSFQMFRNEVVVVVGPSGCGKTTFLMCLAGLDSITSGDIQFKGRHVMQPLDSIGMVFQRSSIFPWRSVRQNLTVRGTALSQLPGSVIEATMARFGLQEFAESWPRQLSGGMLRRLELARTMLRKPNALLLDEPFSALDPVTKSEMHQLVRELRQETRMGMLLVTHDVDEAVAMGDRIVVLTPRPGSIAAEISVTLDENARNIYSMDQSFTSVKAKVLESLGWSNRT